MGVSMDGQRQTDQQRQREPWRQGDRNREIETDTDREESGQGGVMGMIKREKNAESNRQTDRCINIYTEGLGAWGFEGEEMEETG